MPAPIDSRPISTSAGKRLRSDARRNRQRLLDSARELFATDGVEASVEEITRRAGVGMGTLYRHFPTKEQLIDAVLEGAFAEFLALADSALREDDPWRGVCQFLERALELHARNRGLKDVLATSAHGRGRAQAMRAQLWPLVTELVHRAHEQGTLRPDFAPEDIALVLWTGDRVIERSASFAPELWRRFLGLLLDGLGAGSATPLPVPPATQAQLAPWARAGEG